MSYINLAEGALPDDVTKGVISFWFRAPQASIDAAIAEYNAIPFDPDAPPRQLDGVIPLVTFGEIFDAYVPKIEDVVTGTNTLEIWGMGNVCDWQLFFSDTTANAQDQYVAGQDYQLDQSYIGIDCTGSNPDDPSKAYLKVRLQTQDYPQTSGRAWVSKDGGHSDPTVRCFQFLPEYFAIDGPLCDGVLIKPCTDQSSPLLGTGIFLKADSPANASIIYVDETDVFQNAAQDHFGDVSQTIEVTGDEWHHVILSFDISGEVEAQGSLNGGRQSMSSACSMWCAFDDVNYTDKGLPSFYDDPGSKTLGPNAIITKSAAQTFNTSTNQSTSFDYVAAFGQWGHTSYSGMGTPPAYKLASTGLAMGGSFGLPASADMVDHIRQVEMAEFQMFTGITIDTGNDGQRRYFIDEDGRPVPPNQKETKDANGNTTRTSGSIEGLGQEPDILLHGSGNWIEGRNTGSSGVDYGKSPPKPIPDGQFEPIGAIKSWRPDPSLYGAQSPSP